LTASTPILDVTGKEPVESRGFVPPQSVVIPGYRPKAFPAGKFGVPCALVIGQRKPSTDTKTSLNDALREVGGAGGGGGGGRGGGEVGGGWGRRLRFVGSRSSCWGWRSP